MAKRCGYCHRPIFKLVTGEWYHDHNGSTSCRPGEGSDRRAFPGGAPDWSRPSKAGAVGNVPGSSGEAGSPHG